ncbi:MAG: LD-carboxypeptidase [Thermaerobacter sp.]|nr:LD-carboxypeptidase [Thermaerobacter sp.]
MTRDRTDGPAVVYPSKPRAGDRVAVLSPSAGLPAHFPAPYELGLARLVDPFQLAPVEYPTTRAAHASPAARAADLHAAFGDPSIKAIIATIGGDDELRVLAHVDPDLLRTHPKPFFGYSDNTNLLHLLWGLGIVGYHGGSVMVQWGRPGRMHPVTVDSLWRALFTHGKYVLPTVTAFTDEERDWSDPDALTDEPPLVPAEPWEWYGVERIVEGRLWGGNLETIDGQLTTSRYLAPLDAYEGAVLFFETSEEMPPASYVHRVLMRMGERGLLQRFSAVLVGRPKCWSLVQRWDADAKGRYAQDQRAAILSAMREYLPKALMVFNVDFGHTDPQYVMPHGGWVRVDGIARRITVMY